MLSFLSRRSSLLIRKAATYRNCFESNSRHSLQNSINLYRSLSSHSQEHLYIPFATDVAREHASIMFWVSKNTNLKEVNVNIRVYYSFSGIIP